MSLTRKTFLRRASVTAAAVAVTSLGGAGTAEAGPTPHMRSVIALLTNAARQLANIAIDNPNIIDDPNAREQLQAIIATCEDIHATADRMLGTRG